MQKKENRGQPMVLTSGSIKKQLVLFSIPIFLGTLLQQLYNVIDAVVAGRLVNEDALSAIGVSVPINEKDRMKQGTRFDIMLSIAITALLSMILLFGIH